MKLLIVSSISFFVAFVLSACGQDEKLMAANLKVKVAEVAAAKAETELFIIKEAAAKTGRQVEAVKTAGRIARTVVRSSQLTDRSGCRITPAALTTSVFYKEFGPKMEQTYDTMCHWEVKMYTSERKVAAAKAVATAEAIKQKNAQLAEAKPRKK